MRISYSGKIIECGPLSEIVIAVPRDSVIDDPIHPDAVGFEWHPQTPHSPGNSDIPIRGKNS